MNGNGNGRKNGGRVATFKRWIPKKWTPVYEEIVALSCAGKTNKELAEQFGYAEMHVSLILTSPQAAILRKQILDELHKRAIDGIPRRMEAIALKSVERLQALLNDDDKFEESPFQVVDRGLKVLLGTGHLKRDDVKQSPGMHVERAIIFSGEHTEDIKEALKLSEQAKQLHSGPELDNDALE